MVLLDDLNSSEDALAVANRLLAALEKPYQICGQEVFSTASIGIATSEQPGSSADEMLHDADMAMYSAKLAGKNRAVLFDVSMRQEVQDRLRLEAQLRRAIEGRQLHVVYQPIVSLETGEMVSVEALVRWTQEDGTSVPPSKFIPIAEETGLIHPLGDWVVGEACRRFVEWQESMGAAAPQTIHVNLSRKQLSNSALLGAIQKHLQRAGMDPQQLCLEVTESSAMEDVAAGSKALRALRAIGIRIALDDFGTGQSSLASLKHLPIDELKLDRSFIVDMADGRDVASLVSAVTQLARNLKIPVVAEGIEVGEQAAFLQALDCQYGQGYLFSKPVSAEEFVRLGLLMPGGERAVSDEKVSDAKMKAA